jgi:hypothetical protein
MRTISGQIGKTDREDYKLDAVVATIGIRGTDFSVTKNGDKVSGSVNSGKINVAAKEGGNKDIPSGRSFRLTGSKGSIIDFQTPPEQNSEDTEASEKDADEQDGQEKQSSESEENTDEAAGETSGSNDEDEGTSEESGSSSAGSETESDSATDTTGASGDSDSSPSDSGSTGSGTTVTTSSTVSTTSDSTSSTVPATNPTQDGTQQIVVAAPNPTGSGSAAPLGATTLVGFVEKNSVGVTRGSVGSVTVGTESAITIDSSAGEGIVTGINYIDTSGNCSPCTFASPTTTTNTLNDVTKLTIGGTDVTWGRWNSGYTVTENGAIVDTDGSFHFIYADQLTSSAQLAAVAATKSGQYIYGLNSAGDATAPEIEGGTTGSMVAYNGSTTPSGTYIIVNWTDQTLATVNLEATAVDPNTSNTRLYTLNKESATAVSLDTVLNGGEVKLKGACTGDGTACEPDVDLAGQMSMGFVGDSAEGVITTYGATGEASGGESLSITGAALLKDKGVAP